MLNKRRQKVIKLNNITVIYEDPLDVVIPIFFPLVLNCSNNASANTTTCVKKRWWFNNEEKLRGISHFKNLLVRQWYDAKRREHGAGVHWDTEVGFRKKTIWHALCRWQKEANNRGETHKFGEDISLKLKIHLHTHKKNDKYITSFYFLTEINDKFWFIAIKRCGI